MRDYEQPNIVDLKDEKTLNKLIMEHEHIIKILISKFKIQPKDYDDAMQEGRLGLLKAIKSYVPEKGTTFSTFASLCIKRHLLTYLRGKNRLKNRALNSYTEIESMIDTPVSYQSEIENDIITRLEFVDIYKLSMDKLTKAEKNIFKAYVKGYSVSELSEEYNMPKRNIYRIIADAKKIIEEKLNQE